MALPKQRWMEGSSTNCPIQAMFPWKYHQVPRGLSTGNHAEYCSLWKVTLLLCALWCSALQMQFPEDSTGQNSNYPNGSCWHKDFYLHHNPVIFLKGKSYTHNLYAIIWALFNFIHNFIGFLVGRNHIQQRNYSPDLPTHSCCLTRTKMYQWQVFSQSEPFLSPPRTEMCLTLLKATMINIFQQLSASLFSRFQDLTNIQQSFLKLKFWSPANLINGSCHWYFPISSSRSVIAGIVIYLSDLWKYNSCNSLFMVKICFSLLGN